MIAVKNNTFKGSTCYPNCISTYVDSKNKEGSHPLHWK